MLVRVSFISCLLKVIDMDMVLTCNAVLEILSVLIRVQVVIRNGDLSAFCDGDGDRVALYCNDVKDDGVFSVEELKFFEIEFVHGIPP